MTVFVELYRSKNLVVTLRKWSENLWYLQVTREIKEPNSQWYQCTVLKRTLPIYHLEFIYKFIKGTEYTNFFDRRAKKLHAKALRKVESW